MNRRAVAVVLLLAACVAVASVVMHKQQADAQPVRPHHVSAPHLPAPTSAAGYTRLWDSLNPDVWGGADVSLSVPLPDGRAVWLYGDTLSGYHGMVHSSAITQDGGRLHVSHDGDQLLPTAPDSHGRTVVYWIESARLTGAAEITASVAPTWVNGTSGWGRVSRQNRLAVLSVSRTGDVTFTHWAGQATPPHLVTKWLTPADGAPFQREGVLFYGKRSHPEAKLSGGRHLVTICRNSVKPVRLRNGSVDYRAYRPVFTSAPDASAHLASPGA